MSSSADLGPLFAPRSVALIGATDKSPFSWSTLTNLVDNGFKGKIYLVNGRGGEVHGRPAIASIADADGPVDLAFIMLLKLQFPVWPTFITG